MICQRYERHATVITSNRDFSEWPLVFANPLMGSASMDRLVHRAVKLVIEGKSYRMDSFVRRSRELSQPRRAVITAVEVRFAKGTSSARSQRLASPPASVVLHRGYPDTTPPEKTP